MKFKDDAIFIIQTLNQNGYEAYLVGGCVRDALLHKETHDIDITTSAFSSEIKSCFKDYPILDTGIKHGTLTLILHKTPYEITTYRIDKNYLDHRHPASITFTRSLKEDLKRRDFTINALCWHPKSGILDLQHGIKDLNCQLIRSIGNPDTRFNEDSLRILRALRFASVLNFTIEQATEKSMFKNKELLKSISSERINQEFSKLLTGKNAPFIMEKYADILAVFMPEISELKKNSEIFKEMIDTLKRSPEILTLRLALLSNSFYPDSISSSEAFLSRLKYSNQIIKKIKTLLILQNMPADTRIDIKKILSVCSDDSILEELLLMKQIKSEHFPSMHIQSQIQDIKKKQDCLTLKDCCINGKDCLNLQIPDKMISCILNQILNEIIEEKLPNEKNACLIRAKELAQR